MKLTIQKNAKTLAIFAIVCTAVVGVTNELTKDKIKSQEQAELLNTLKSIVPPRYHDNDMSQYCVEVKHNKLSSDENQIAYLATIEGNPAAAAITSTAPDGYNGKIHLISAFDIKGDITGVRVLKHKETPGLGDKVELRRSQWIKSFDNKTAEDIAGPRWLVKKDGGMFDQFTGATITPRAVIKSVRNAAQYFEEHKTSLFEQPNTCGDPL
jgi:H+/Na+-translocating ferredoxin:NAD+ oxidoreductase subunit G